MGANIKIGADTANFQKQMKTITQDLKVMSSELATATTKAELFGREQDKLGAKSNELSSKITGQTKLFDLQKQAIQTLTSDVQKYRDRNTELEKSIADVESKLRSEIKASGEGSEKTKELTKKHNDLQKEFKENLKAIDKSESAMQTYKVKMNETEDAILRTKKALEETDQKLQTMKWDNAGKSLQNVGSKAKDIGESGTTKITMPLVAAGVASSKLASDLAESTNKVEVVFGNSAKNVEDWSGTTLKSFGIAKGSALEMASLFGDMGTSMGQSTEEASNMSMNLTGLAGDLSSFKNIGLDQASEALRGIFTGEGESLKSLGVIMQDSTLKAFALSNGYTKNYDDMTQAEKVQLRYAYVMNATKNAQGDFARTSDSAANQARIFKESAKELGETFGTQILPKVTPVLTKFNDMIQSFAKMSPASQNVVLAIAGIVAIIFPLLIIVGEVVGAIGTISTAIGAGGIAGALGGLAVPIGIAIGAIALLVGAFVFAYNNSEDFRNKVNGVFSQIKEIISTIIENIKTIITVFVQLAQKIWKEHGDAIMNIISLAFDFIASIVTTALNVISNITKVVAAVMKGDWGQAWEGIKGIFSSAWNGITSILSNGFSLAKSIFDTGFGILLTIASSIFGNIKNAITSPIESATNFIREQVDKIKGFFSNLHIQLPDIKLPHFSVKNWSINPADWVANGAPFLDISWYAEGGIMTNPTLFGINGSNAMVGGEAGAEAILPLSKLWQQLDKNFEKLENRLKNTGGNSTITIPVFLNGKEIAIATAPYSDIVQGKNIKFVGRGRGL